MDVPWALNELRKFVEITTMTKIPVSGTWGEAEGYRMRGDNSEIVSVAQVVEQILPRVLGRDWISKTTKPTRPRRYDWSQHNEAAQRAIVMLERQEELREKLGDNAPQLNAARLHPWIWSSARSLWESRHYAEAVLAASVKVNAETQNKVERRDISETKLFQQVFSLEAPQASNPRLRIIEDNGSPTFKNVHRRAMAFAEGCYAAIRNPASHELQDDLTEHLALEQLAAFSVLARWVDNAVVQR